MRHVKRGGRRGHNGGYALCSATFVWVIACLWVLVVTIAATTAVIFRIVCLLSLSLLLHSVSVVVVSENLSIKLVPHLKPIECTGDGYRNRRRRGTGTSVCHTRSASVLFVLIPITGNWLDADKSNKQKASRGANGRELREKRRVAGSPQQERRKLVCGWRVRDEDQVQRKWQNYLICFVNTDHQKPPSVLNTQLRTFRQHTFRQRHHGLWLSLTALAWQVVDIQQLHARIKESEWRKPPSLLSVWPISSAFLLTFNNN